MQKVQQVQKVQGDRGCRKVQGVRGGAEEKNVQHVQTVQKVREVERETGIEPATSSLGSWHSTAELLPPREQMQMIMYSGEGDPLSTAK